MNIAVLVNSEGNTASFEENGTIKVFSKINGKWTGIREAHFTIFDAGSPAKVRSELKTAAEWLADCKVIVVKQIKGIAFTVFEGMLFSIWEMKGNPLDFLDYICENEEEEKKKKAIVPKAIEPEEKEKGCYFINLEAVMNDKNAPTSKQVLLPFFKEKEFTELEVVCEHIPKWFEREFPSLKMEAKAEKCGELFHVKVYPNK